MIVVADTCPISYLILLGHLDLLHRFYERVVVPPAVWRELEDEGSPVIVRSQLLEAPDWLEKRTPRQGLDPSLSFLDPGESEAIAVALELRADRVIIDETLGRQEARRLGLSVIGTLGVLRNAARANWLDLPEVLSALQKTSFHVAPELIRSLLEEDVLRKRGA
jgi:predicted nucleic acid-binding protein